MRDVILALDKLYPGLGEHLREETTVAIDGEIHDQPAYFQKVRPAARSSSSRSSKAAEAYGIASLRSQ